MKYVVIYNTTTGAIICQSTLADETAPTNGLVVTVPDGKRLVSINPQTKEPVFANATSDTIADIELALVEVDLRLRALEG